jgi:hypothetical protein
MPRTLRLAGLQIALVAMVLRALLPAGWMPDTAAGTPFVICTLNGPMLAARPADAGKHQPGHDDGRHNDVCPFAASIHFATPTTVATIAPFAPVASRAYPPLPAPAVHAAIRYALQSPRAPPSLV